MPASATVSQGLKLAESLIRGEPDGARIIKSIVKDKVRELV